MRIVKKGELPADRAMNAARKFKSRVVCDTCKSTLEFHANDLKSYCVPGQLKVECPFCVSVVGVDEGGLPNDILLYTKLVFNQAIPPLDI